MSTGIGNKIKKRRKELGLSQEELAKRLNLKSKSTICKVERGDDNLTSNSIELYAEALNTTPAYLMGWEDDDGNILVEVATVPKSDLTFDQLIEAEQLFKMYENASPEVRNMIDYLLKSNQPKQQEIPRLKSEKPRAEVPHLKKDTE